MASLENRFVRAAAFLFLLPAVTIAVGFIQGEPIGETLFLGVISGLVFAFLAIFLRIGGPEWGNLR